MDDQEKKIIVTEFIEKLIELQKKNGTQVQFLDSLEASATKTSLLNQFFTNKSLFQNFSGTNYQDVIAGIRIRPKDWTELGIRLGDKWKEKGKPGKDNRAVN